MDNRILVALLVPLLIELSLKGVALWDIAHRDQPRHLPRVAWVVIILLVNLFGPISYLLVGRDE